MGVGSLIGQNIGNVFVCASLGFFVANIYKYVIYPKIVPPPPEDSARQKRISELRTIARKTIKQQQEFLNLVNYRAKEPWWHVLVMSLVVAITSATLLVTFVSYGVHINVGAGVFFMLLFPFASALVMRLLGIRVKSTVLDMTGW